MSEDRKAEFEIEIDATPEEVWEALATAEGIMSWFAPVAKVEPGPDGRAFISWGEGMEGWQRIEAWEPGRHLRLKDRHGVDYYIETKGGRTVLRLVQSGFGPEASFDAEFESTIAAWPAFLQMLKHSAERGVRTCQNVTVFRILAIPRDQCLAALKPELPEGQVRYERGGIRCIEFPDGRMLTIFCENCGAQSMLTIVSLLYGADQAQADTVRAHWTAVADRIAIQ
jgi:uncharacterized protein YndB with AHSA1/START domain